MDWSLDPVNLVIDDITVKFPCQPYELQTAYMNQVIQCLKKGVHGVLESPTGTGKTLSLLCASLAWQETFRKRKLNLEASHDPMEAKFGEKVPKIFFSTRTHTQISKAMKELRRIPYYNHIKMTVLGSRDQLCIHPLVKKEALLSVKNALCKYHVKAQTCAFAGKAQNAKTDLNFISGVTDIEDLVDKCKKINSCPYYTSKELVDTSDVVFLPYNYLLDAQIRKNFAPFLAASVIIVDEAHNVDKICEESSSVSVSNTDIQEALADVVKDMQDLYEGTVSNYGAKNIDREYCADELVEARSKLEAMASEWHQIGIGPNDEGEAYKGSEIFRFLDKAGVNEENVVGLISVMRKVSEYLTSQEQASMSRRGFALNKVADSLEIIFSSAGIIQGYSVSDSFYRVYAEPEPVTKSERWAINATPGSKPRKINYWCFTPSLGLSALVQTGVHSIIFTSGTLSPLNSTVREFGLLQPVTLENPHIIEPSQVLIRVVTKGPTGRDLNSSYLNRSNDLYWREIGLTLQNFCRIIPDGTLVFFPSYVTMNKAVSFWQGSGLWNQICSVKPIFLEPQNKRELNVIMKDYYEAVDRGKGGILIGVCRGKVSEGLDFSDKYGRCVMVTGIPYPPLHDPKIKLKKDYIDCNRSITMTGETWYRSEATKAVNQAIGRVIRHAQDYGAILLCDVKFNNPAIIHNLSKWLQPHTITARHFGESMGHLRQFLRNNKKREAELAARTAADMDATLASSSQPHQAFTSAADQPSTSRGVETSAEDQPSTSRGVEPSVKKSRRNPRITITPEDTTEERESYDVDKDIPKALDFQQIITKSTKIKVRPAHKRLIKLRSYIFRVGTVEDPEEAEAAANQVDTTNFLMTLKSNLDSESYSTFVSIIKKYQLTLNLKEILESLSVLFPKEDEAMKGFFKGCYRLFGGKDRETFDNFCKKFYS